MPAHSILASSSSSNSNFLVPNATLIEELVAFLIVLWIVARFVLPPLRSAMAQRAEGIRNTIQAADAARAEADNLLGERRAVLEQARVEARSIVDQASEIAEQMKEQGRRRGEEEYQRIVERAAADIELERQRARDEVTRQLGALVMAAAEQVVGAELDETRHRGLIDEAIAAAERSEATV
jgi:F-type H+-transporting ATPase subunit b